MARTFSGTGQWLSKGSAVVANQPNTQAAWINLGVNNIDMNPMGVGDNTSNSGPVYQLIFDGSSRIIRAEVAGSVDDNTAASTTLMNPGIWFHGGAVFISNTSRKIYFNGVMQGSSTVTVTAANTMNNTKIGDLVALTGSLPFNGSVAFAAIWNIDLSDPEMLALSQGISPKLIRHQNLKAYCRMLGGNSPEPDFIGGSWTLTGTPTFTDNLNPRILNP